VREAYGTGTPHWKGGPPLPVSVWRDLRGSPVGATALWYVAQPQNSLKKSEKNKEKSLKIRKCASIL